MNRFITCDHAQGSIEWFADRCGRLNGSEVSAIYAAVKTGEAAGRRDLRYKIALEQLTGKVAQSDFKGNNDTARGTELEPMARMVFEMRTDLMVRESGYVYLSNGVKAGCSVDGFIDAPEGLGIVEFKCPKPAIQIGYIERGGLPPAYLPQVEHNMWVTGAQFCWFMAYNPDLPKGLQCYMHRIERDQERIDAHESAVLQFLLETAKLESDIRALAEKYTTEHELETA